MDQTTYLDFLPERESVVQIVRTAKPEDVLNEAYRRLVMLADSLVIMGENQTLLNVAPEYSSLFMSWAQVAHEAGVMVQFANNADSSGFQSTSEGEQHA